MMLGIYDPALVLCLSKGLLCTSCLAVVLTIQQPSAVKVQLLLCRPAQGALAQHAGGACVVHQWQPPRGSGG